MGHRDPDGHTRWHRLLPRDRADAGLLLLVVGGLILSLAAAVGLDATALGIGALAFVLGPLLVLHGSTPFFAFVGLAFYLTRRGRTIGSTRRFIWAGVALTAPLWFFVGQSITVRGIGDATTLVLPWNLAAFGVMGIGVWRELHDR